MSGQENSSQENGTDSGKNLKDAGMFDPKPKPKMIRVLTVLAYVLSVSMAAILLSIYYIFMWDARPHFGARVSDTDLDGLVEIIVGNGSSSSGRLLPQSLTKNTSSSIYVEPTAYDVGNSTSLPWNTTTEVPEGESGSEENLTRIRRETGDLLEALEMEMQQQFTALESEPIRATTQGAPVAITTSTEETFTWSDDYDSFEELGKASILVRKIMDGDNYDEK